MWVLALSLLEIPSWFIFLQCMINEQTFVLIKSYTKLKIQIKACKSYVMKDLLAHFTFTQLLCKYNFEIKILCKRVHSRTHTHPHIYTHTTSFHQSCTSDSWKYLLLYHGDYTTIQMLVMFYKLIRLISEIQTYVYIHTHTHTEEIHTLSRCLLSIISKTSKQKYANKLNSYNKCSRVISKAPTMLIKYKLLQLNGLEPVLDLF